MEEIISLREFARRSNIDPKTVRNAIKLGKITNGVIYENNKPSILYEVAKREIEEIGINTRISYKQVEKPKEKNEPIAGLDGETSLITATRAEKIFKAQLASLAVDEQAGLLVNKSAVYSQLFEFAIEIKSSLLSIPDRITDDLISISADRHAFHSLLAKTIEAELERLSNFEFTKV